MHKPRNPNSKKSICGAVMRAPAASASLFHVRYPAIAASFERNGCPDEIWRRATRRMRCQMRSNGTLYCQYSEVMLYNQCGRSCSEYFDRSCIFSIFLGVDLANTAQIKLCYILSSLTFYCTLDSDSDSHTNLSATQKQSRDQISLVSLCYFPLIGPSVRPTTKDPLSLLI